jgi:subtilase family serine protease
MTPAEIRTAYGINSLAGNGAGQTIAIVDAYDDPTIASDLQAFDAAFGLPDPPSFRKVDQTAGRIIRQQIPVGQWRSRST